MNSNFLCDSMMIEHTKADSNPSIKFSLNGRTNCSSSASLSYSNGSSKSPRCANYIPDDLIIEVLSRLPGKTLLKFMCVSKSWRNLISNFMPTSPMSGLLLMSFPYSKEPPRDTFIALLRSGCSTSNCLEALQLHCASLRISHPKIAVTHHCNGLFLLSDYQFGIKLRKPLQSVHYYVCNPATNQCVALPAPPPFSVWCNDESALVFDPRKSSHYKVLSISCYCDPSNQVEVQIFSSDKNQWVSFSAYFQKRTCGCGSLFSLRERPVYLNGALHSLCNKGLCMISLYVEEKLLLRDFKLPGRAAGIVDQCLGESEGCLYYAACYPDKLQIWMLGSFDPDKWFKKHTLRIANWIKAISPFAFFMSDTIMAFHTNLEVLFVRHEGVIFSYYFGSGMKDIDRLKEVCSIERIQSIDFVYPFSRCLASLNDACK